MRLRERAERHAAQRRDPYCSQCGQRGHIKTNRLCPGNLPSGWTRSGFDIKAYAASLRKRAQISGRTE